MNETLPIPFPVNDTCPCFDEALNASLAEIVAATKAVSENCSLLLDDDTNAGLLEAFSEENAAQEGEESEGSNSLFEVIYTCFVLVLMFAALISDRIGADSVMMGALTMFMAAEIVTIEEGLKGFANEGLLTVLVLFVVADGISKTGALDWYMSKLLGRPKTVAAAQSKLMIPIAIVSAFLNNTPVVAVMIPIVQKWSKNIGKSAQQLLIPLSFASILGGTCTLIGTSTNLVVAGLLQEEYPEIQVGLFDLSIYGVPIAMVGLVYVLLASPYLLPGGTGAAFKCVGGGGGTGALDIFGDGSGNDNVQDLLLGAKLMPWSPASGRSVKRSGLRDTGGIYLVSVHRAATGNVHRAVGQDFVLNVGDVLYFTGLVEGFGEFCEEQGMEVLTNELQEKENEEEEIVFEKDKSPGALPIIEQEMENDLLFLEEGDAPSQNEDPFYAQSISDRQSNTALLTVVEGAEEDFADTDRDVRPVMEVGLTKESLLQADEAERSRSITRMIDMIRGVAREEPTQEEDQFLLKDSRVRGRQRSQHGAHKVVVTSEHGFVVVGVDARDRPGLLLDISKGLLQLNLTLRHSEASVIGTRSLSIWRCEVIEAELPDLEEIWSVMTSLLETFDQGSSQAVKRGGLRVIRAVVTPTSRLNGNTMNTVDFRDRYKAAIVAIQKGGRNVPLSGVVFGSGDVLVLKANDDSPLLKQPPADFYKRERNDGHMGGNLSRSGSVNSFLNRMKKKVSNATLNTMNSKNSNNNNETKEDKLKDSRHKASFDGPDLEEAKVNSDVGISFEQASGADDFYIGESLNQSGDDDFDDDDDDVDFNPNDDNNNGMKLVIDDIQASMNAIGAEEAIWKDLQVLFVDKDKERSGDGAREFLTAMEIPPKSKLADRTVADTGLDKLPGVFLVSIDRPTGETQKAARPVTTDIMKSFQSVASDAPSVVSSVLTTDPVFRTIPPDVPLKAGDVLWFAGGAQSVGDLRKIPGLISHEKEEVEKLNENVHDRRLVEAVIARRGPLVGKTVKQVRFRTRYGAAVIAVHRDGSRIHEHPGRIRLQAGDVLLLEAGPTFIKGSYDNDKSFSLLAEVEDSAPPRLKLLIPALLLTFAMLAVYTAGISSLLVCALVASIFMIGFGILSEQEARDAVNWEVFVTIAAAFGIGTALVNSGVAGSVANFLVTVGTAVGEGPAGLFAAVYLATFLISNVVTNNAAAALIFPIAINAAKQTDTDAILMSYCVMLGASASFMSPFGYTTNLMIYGPGGYKYNDFLVIGTPMQIVLWILSVALLATTTSSNFYWSWLICFGLLVLVMAITSLDLGAVWRKFATKDTSNSDKS